MFCVDDVYRNTDNDCFFIKGVILQLSSAIVVFFISFMMGLLICKYEAF